MALLPAIAYGFAQTFRPRDLAPCFAGARVRTTKRDIVVEYDPSGYAVAYDFGAVVFINVSAEERARVIGAILTRVATDEPHPPLEEEFSVEVKEGAAAHGEVRFDRVVVPDLDGARLDIIAILLAQSVAIDYYEEDLQDIMRDLERRTSAMAKSGRVEGSVKQLVRFVANALEAKNQVIAALAVLDKPAITWDSEPLDRLHRELRQMLEIDDRFRALEHKLRAVQDSLELLLDLHNNRRAHQLEMVIILLIVFEILWAFVEKAF
jgi:required for meiotic nuclear division protein 1